MVVTLLRALSTSSSSSLCLLLIFFHRALRLMMMMRKNCVKRVRGVIGRPRLEAPFLVSALSHSLSMSRFFGFFGKSWFFLFDFVFACIITRSYGDKFGSRCSVGGERRLAVRLRVCGLLVARWRRRRLDSHQAGERGLAGVARGQGAALAARAPEPHTRSGPTLSYFRRRRRRPLLLAVSPPRPPPPSSSSSLSSSSLFSTTPSNTQSSAPIFPPNAWGCLSFHSLFSLMVVVYNGDRSASTAFDPPPFFVIPPVN